MKNDFLKSQCLVFTSTSQKNIFNLLDFALFFNSTFTIYLVEYSMTVWTLEPPLFTGVQCSKILNFSGIVGKKDIS